MQTSTLIIVIQSLNVLSIIFGLASVIILLNSCLGQNKTFWIFFIGVNASSLSSLIIWLTINIIDNYTIMGRQDSKLYGGIIVVIALALMVWSARFEKKPIYQTCALVLLTTAWLIAEFRFIIDLFSLPCLIKDPAALCNELIAPITPILCCLSLLILRLLFRRGPLDPRAVPQLHRYLKYNKCTNCYATIDTDAVFCTNCGAQLYNHKNE